MFTALGIAGGAAVVAGAGAAGASAMLYKKEQAKKKRRKKQGEQERNWAVQYQAAELEALQERLDDYDQDVGDVPMNKMQVATILYELGRRLEEQHTTEKEEAKNAKAAAETAAAAPPDDWTAVDLVSVPSLNALSLSSDSFSSELFVAPAESAPAPPTPLAGSNPFLDVDYLNAKQIEEEMGIVPSTSEEELSASSDVALSEEATGGVSEEVQKRLKARARDQSFPPFVRAVAMYQRAVALTSHSLAARRLGVLFLEGHEVGMERHHGKAERLLRIAARKGDHEATYRLGMLLVAHCKVEKGLKYLRTCSKTKGEFQRRAGDAISCTDKTVKDKCTCLNDGSCVLDSYPVMDFLVEEELESVKLSMSLGNSSDSIGKRKSSKGNLARFMKKRSPRSSPSSSPSSSPRSSISKSKN